MIVSIPETVNGSARATVPDGALTVRFPKPVGSVIVPLPVNTVVPEEVNTAGDASLQFPPTEICCPFWESVPFVSVTVPFVVMGLLSVQTPAPLSVRLLKLVIPARPL